MDIRGLKTFLSVAERGTIAAAAKELHSVQSNITNRIKALEDELETDLFVRSRNGMTLTAAGHVFKEHAQKVVDAQEQAKSAVSNFSNSVRILRIGSMESTLAVRLPQKIVEFRRLHPNVDIRVVSGPTDELTAQLLENKLDLAFVGGQFAHDELTGDVAFSEEMVLVTALDVDELRDVANCPLIVFRAGCSYRAFSQIWLKKLGLAPNSIFEIGTLDGLLGCVAAGLGVTLLPYSVVDTSRHRAHVKIHPIDDPGRHIDTIALRRRPETQQNGAVEAFARFVCGMRVLDGDARPAAE